MKTSKIIFNVVYWTIMIALFVWFILSWGEIIRHNNNLFSDPVYSPWNLFVLLF